jgi:hypothetical protein
MKTVCVVQPGAGSQGVALKIRNRQAQKKREVLR